MKKTVAAACLAALLLGACGEEPPPARKPAPAPRTQPQAAAPTDSTTASQPLIEPRLAALPDFSELVEKRGAGVVNVSVVGAAEASDDDPAWRFFRRRQPPPRGGLVRGMGSGFIISPDGVVLTNAHVVENAQVVTVRLADKREFRARVIGADEGSDVAVLKIDARNLPALPLGDPATVKVGEWVLAIGSPYGLENTVTAGILSAKARSLPSDSYVPFLQTDVAVNPGNSGGPLFNLRGEVIGINSQIYSTTGGFMGLSFAIPIDMAVRVAKELQDNGRVRRGRLGVAVSDVTPDLASSVGLPNVAGAIVGSVEPRGPAERAGVRPGDVILAVGDTPIRQFADLPMKVAELAPGTETTLRIWRGGSEREVRIVIGEAQ